MMRYHDRFPAAPQALVSGIAAACQIPSIVGARVGKDGSVFLDVFQNDDFHLDLNHLVDIADFFEVAHEEVRIENGPRPETVTVTVCSTDYDFSEQFRGFTPPSGPADPSPARFSGEEDSEESVEAHVALTRARGN